MTDAEYREAIDDYIEEQWQAIVKERDQLIAEARQHVLQPVYESMGGASRSTKRDAVEAAFPYAMEFWFRSGEALVQRGRYSNPTTVADGLRQSMYAYVSEEMRASWTWLLLWLIVRPAVWRLVVALVAWLLIRNDHERMRRASKVAWDFIEDAKREAGT